jgi:hypothetical protein
MSVADFLTGKGEELYFDEALDRWRAKNKEAWHWAKCRLCYEESIAIMFEENELLAHTFDYIPTRLIMINDEEAVQVISELGERLRKDNMWLENEELEGQEFYIG